MTGTSQPRADARWVRIAAGAGADAPRALAVSDEPEAPANASRCACSAVGSAGSMGRSISVRGAKRSSDFSDDYRAPLEHCVSPWLLMALADGVLAGRVGACA